MDNDVVIQIVPLPAYDATLSVQPPQTGMYLAFSSVLPADATSMVARAVLVWRREKLVLVGNPSSNPFGG